MRVRRRRYWGGVSSAREGGDKEVGSKFLVTLGQRMKAMALIYKKGHPR